MTEKDTLELPKGETVDIERADEILPRIVEVDGALGLTLEDGRVKMAERNLDTTLSLSTYDNSVDNPKVVASLFAGVSSIEDDDVNMEYSFHSFDEVRKLRDALELVLRYHDEPLEMDG